MLSSPASLPSLRLLLLLLLAAASADALRVGVFLGSVRPGRLAERVGAWVTSEIESRGHDVVLADPLQLQLPMLERPAHWYGDAEELPDYLGDITAALTACDAFVVVSNEYNQGPGPALVNTLAHFGGATFQLKPAGIVTYSPGQFGGRLALPPLRSMLAELGLLTVPQVISVPEAHAALSADGKPADAEAYARRFGAQFDQLVRVAEAMSMGASGSGSGSGSGSASAEL